MKKISHILVRVVFAVAALAIVGSYALAWTPPAQPATGGNVVAPLNTGAAAQIKNASLQLIGDLTAINGAFGGLVFAPKVRIGCVPGGNCPGVLSSDIFLAGLNPGGQAKGIAISGDGTFMAGLIGGLSGNNSVGTFLKGIKVNPTTGQISIVDGTQGAKKVLTSDANGNASWANGSIEVGAQRGDAMNNDVLIYKNPGVTLSTTPGWKAADTIPVYRKNYGCVAGPQDVNYYQTGKTFSGDLTMEQSCFSLPCKTVGATTYYWSCGGQTNNSGGSSWQVVICGDGVGGTPTPPTYTEPQVCYNNAAEIGKIIGCDKGSTASSGSTNNVHCN